MVADRNSVLRGGGGVNLVVAGGCKGSVERPLQGQEIPVPLLISASGGDVPTPVPTNPIVAEVAGVCEAKRILG